MKKLFLITLISTVVSACGTVLQSTPAVTLTDIPIPSTTPLPTTISTATQIVLNVSPDVLTVLQNERILNLDGSVKTNVIHSENTKTLEINPKNISYLKVNDTSVDTLVIYTDTINNATRYIWNKDKKAWAPEFGASLDYIHPELSPTVPFDAYMDGSAALSAALQISEQPAWNDRTATYPHYMVNLINQRGYEISLRPTNAMAFPSTKVTQISHKVNKPFEYIGVQQTKEKSGNIIYVIVKNNWNPTSENTNQSLPTFQGFDKTAFDQWISYPLILKFLSNQKDMPGELIPVFPAPPGSNVVPPEFFSYDDQPLNPFVRSLVQQNIIRIFPQEVRNAIIAMYPHAGDKYDSVNNPKSIPLDQLPPELSRLILYTGIRNWR